MRGNRDRDIFLQIWLTKA